jgi:hypothetical protein
MLFGQHVGGRGAGERVVEPVGLLHKLVAALAWQQESLSESAFSQTQNKVRRRSAS